MGFMLAEAGVGAALVLFRLVADNPSMARALFMSVHLTNTFLLLACLALTAYWLSGGARADVRNRGRLVVRFGAGAVAILLAGVSGAVAALGDTLYPAGSLTQALGADLSAPSHLLVRLRLLHPVITVVVAVALVVTGLRFGYEGRGLSRRLAFAVAGVAVLQVLAGFINVLLLAPVWMQMVHLLIADVLWIGVVLLGASSLQEHRDVPVILCP
jgi:heme A synthase